MASPWRPIESARTQQAVINKDEQGKYLQKPASKVPVAEPIELRETFIPRQPRRSLKDLILSEDTLAQIEVLLTKLKYQHTLYHEWNLIKLDPYGERTAINLYGPPGTGKTFCAEAIAGHLGKALIDVNYAELESKFVGETAKNIVMAFQSARESDAVLFFDEADSILGKRLTDVRQSADYGVNQSRSVMLKQLEAFQGVVVFATNMAKNYDGAFVRRILGHIEFRMPDEVCRQRLWELFLVPELPLDEDVSSTTLAELTDGLSGGEMQNVLVATASAAVGRQGEARRLRMDDFRRQIQIMKDARRNIGNYEYDSSPAQSASEQRIPLRELPPKVKEAIEGKEKPVTSALIDHNVRWANMPREYIPVGLRVLNDVTEADQIVRSAEREALRAILSFCEPAEAEDFWQKARQDGVLEDISSIAGTKWARLIVRDAVAVGFSDGTFSDAERTLIQKIALKLGIEDGFIKMCESWSCRGLHWMQQGAVLVEQNDEM